MSFLKNINESLRGLGWINSRKRNAKTAWPYFLILIMAVTLLYWYAPVGNGINLLVELKDKFVEQIPDFEAKLDSGRLTIERLEQPYIREFDLENEKIVIYIDAVSDPAPKAEDVLVAGRKTGVLITSSDIAMYDNDEGSLEVSDFSEYPDASFDRADVEESLKKIDSNSNYLKMLSLLLIYVFSVASKLFILLIVALIANIVAKLYKREWKYGHLFVAGLFASTLPVLIQLVLSFAYLYSAVLLVVMLLVVFYSKDKVGEKEEASK